MINFLSAMYIQLYQKTLFYKASCAHATLIAELFDCLDGAHCFLYMTVRALPTCSLLRQRIIQSSVFHPGNWSFQRARGLTHIKMNALEVELTATCIQRPTCHVHSQEAQATVPTLQKPWPLTCAGPPVHTGSDRRVLTPSADCSEMGSWQRQRQPHYLSSRPPPQCRDRELQPPTAYRPSSLTGYAKTRAKLRTITHHLHGNCSRWLVQTRAKEIPRRSTVSRSIWRGFKNNRNY
jgi:hypothetical protein